MRLLTAQILRGVERVTGAVRNGGGEGREDGWTRSRSRNRCARIKLSGRSTSAFSLLSTTSSWPDPRSLYPTELKFVEIPPFLTQSSEHDNLTSNPASSESTSVQHGGSRTLCSQSQLCIGVNCAILSGITPTLRRGWMLKQAENVCSGHHRLLHTPHHLSPHKCLPSAFPPPLQAGRSRETIPPCLGRTGPNCNAVLV